MSTPPHSFHMSTLHTLPNSPELSIKVLLKRDPFMVFIFQRKFPSTFQEGRIFREAACGEQHLQFIKQLFPELFKAASVGLEVERRHGGGGECLPQEPSWGSGLLQPRPGAKCTVGRNF